MSNDQLNYLNLQMNSSKRRIPTESFLDFLLNKYPSCFISDPPEFSTGEVRGYISSPLISEASGLAASRRHKDVLYTLNDSGDLPR